MKISDHSICHSWLLHSGQYVTSVSFKNNVLATFLYTIGSGKIGKLTLYSRNGLGKLSAYLMSYLFHFYPTL